MMSRSKHRETRARRWAQRALAWIASIGLLGAAAQAQAMVRLDRAALEARVDAVRAALHEAADPHADPHGNADAAAPGWLLAQWNNWSNWNNWNNWKNWGNWLNK